MARISCIVLKVDIKLLFQSFSFPSTSYFFKNKVEFEDLHKVAHGFSSNLTYIIHDFYNEFHKDKDHTSYASRLWARIFDNATRLTMVKDGFHCNGGHFIVPTYKVYVDFRNCDGVVEILWQGKKGFSCNCYINCITYFYKNGEFSSNLKEFST
jgi:hypothetical protein